jgi:MGT family glycosyltransferase
MAIAQALRARGHLVAAYTGSTAQATFEQEGMRCFPFEAVDEEAILRLLLSDRAAASVIRNPRQRFNILRAWLAETLPAQVADQSAAMDAWRPEVVVSDVMMWGMPLFLHELRRVPVAVSSFMPNCTIPGPDAPPWGLGLPRPKNWRTRALNGLVRVATNLLTRGLRRRVSELRQRHGLGPLTVDVQTFLGSMALYLVPSVPEFDYERGDLPPSVHYVGPLVWNKHGGEPAPGWLDELPSDEPLIHVTEGTMHAGQPFVLRAAVEGLAHGPWQVVITTGRDRDPDTLGLGPIAPNVRVERWVPHSDLLPRTDVLVTTGGGSTTVAGVQAGVPMVVVPTQWDKPENAQRVVEAGMGLRLAPRHCTPARLRRAVARVLNESRFQENARRMSAICARYDGPACAAELIERLMSGPESHCPPEPMCEKGLEVA